VVRREITRRPFEGWWLSFMGLHCRLPYTYGNGFDVGDTWYSVMRISMVGHFLCVLTI